MPCFLLFLCRFSERALQFLGTIFTNWTRYPTCCSASHAHVPPWCSCYWTTTFLWSSPTCSDSSAGNVYLVWQQKSSTQFILAAFS